MFDTTRRRLMAGAVGLAAAASFALPAFAQDGKDTVKAAFVYVGPIGDFGWTYAHDQGRKYLEEKLGDKVETSYVENVAEGPDAERALRAGLVSEIVAEEALLDRGLALADEMLATSPHGLRLSKQALNLNLDAPSLDAAMAIEDRQQVILSATEDHKEALSAFLEKRAPEYRER